MRKAIWLVLSIITFCLFLAAPAHAGFSSLYIFGDSLSTTTNSIPTASTNYAPGRFCNGPVWGEKLAQFQGLTFNTNHDFSEFGQGSSTVSNLLTTFTFPTPPSNALVAVWVANSDLYFSFFFAYTNSDTWSQDLRSGASNTAAIIQQLYDQGCRQLLMLNGVDISESPFFTANSNYDASVRAFVRAQCLAYNRAFAEVIDQARKSHPGLTIYAPDVLGLLDELLANPGNYGLVNPGIDAQDDPALVDKTLNGPGTNYVFWDSIHPTAAVQARMGAQVQQRVTPVGFSSLAAVGGSNRLNLVNLPLKAVGYLESSTDLLSWKTNSTISVSNSTASLWVSHTNASRQFYRLRF